MAIAAMVLNDTPERSPDVNIFAFYQIRSLEED